MKQFIKVYPAFGTSVVSTKPEQLSYLSIRRKNRRYKDVFNNRYIQFIELKTPLFFKEFNKITYGAVTYQPIVK